MGPPPGVRCPMRMTASWLGSNDPTEYKSVARRALNGELPSDPPQTGTDQTPNSRQQNPRSACSGVKRCETQAPLRRHAANLCYRFGPLTPSARSANLFVGDGAKNGSPAPNKEPTNHKQSLDSKKPHTSSSPDSSRKSLQTISSSAPEPMSAANLPLCVIKLTLPCR